MVVIKRKIINLKQGEGIIMIIFLIWHGNDFTHIAINDKSNDEVSDEYMWPN